MCELLTSRGGNQSMKVFFNKPSRALMVADLSRTETRMELVKTANVAPKWDITLISQKCSARLPGGNTEENFQDSCVWWWKHWAEYVSSGLDQQKTWTHHRMHPHTRNFQDKKHQLFWQLLHCDTYLEITMSHFHTKSAGFLWLQTLSVSWSFRG